jgi:hypothetical protein
LEQPPCFNTTRNGNTSHSGSRPDFPGWTALHGRRDGKKRRRKKRRGEERRKEEEKKMTRHCVRYIPLTPQGSDDHPVD